jgi:NRPS condensation-like uncharacterized protein
MPLVFKPGQSGKEGWLPLDNAAKIFPPGTNKTRTLVYRVTAEISRTVRFESLKKASQLTSERYPYFTMHLRRGFFWYWLDMESEGIPVYPDTGEICKAFRFSWNQEPLCRIIAKDNRISAEFYHVITDGYGSMEFFKTLLATYAELEGVNIESGGFSHYQSSPKPGETEDGYNRYFNPKLPAPRQLSKAYHLPFPFLKNQPMRVLSAQLNPALVREKSKSRGITITEYLVAVYLWTIQDIYNKVRTIRNLRRRPIIRIQVPVNLRSLFPSNTLRNFALFVTPDIDMRLGFYSFEEITHIVHHYMQQQTDPKLMQKIIYRNVRNERSLFIRLIPLPMKDRVLNYFFKRSGMELYSGLITNLGKLEFTGEFGSFIERLRFYPPPPDKAKINIAMITYNQKMVLTFANGTVSMMLEKTFLQFLRDDGIPVTLINP